MKQQLTHDQVMNAIDNGVIATDVEKHICFVNSQGAKILKLAKKKIDRAYFSDIMPKASSLVDKCLETGEPQLGHFISYKNNSLEIDITPIKQGKSILGAVCNFRRIREFERSTHKPESNELLKMQFDTIFNFSSWGIWVLDGKGTVIKVNSAAERLIGINSKDVIGKNISTLVEKSVIDQALTPDILASKKPVSKLLYVIKTKKYILSEGIPILDENKNIIFVIVNEYDMTTLNSLQEQLTESRIVAEKYKDELYDLTLKELKKQEIVAESEEMRQVLRVSLKLARLNVSNILLLGESGTGKGLLAKFIHKNSNREKKSFIQVNCAALPESLLEAELFGFEKGAFTGAGQHGKIGLFELAQGGTLFLDEIWDLPFSVQAKLLKCLDDHEIMHIGGLKQIKIDCIIIAATNRDLESLVKEQKFRKDLFYRLNAFNIRIPPLRERPEDIFELSNYYLNKYNQFYNLQKRLSSNAIKLLQSYPFSGNVRELKNIMKNAVVLSEKDVLDGFVPDNIESRKVNEKNWSAKYANHTRSLAAELNETEKEILEDAMMYCKTTRKMANYLGISQSSVSRKLKKHRLLQFSIHK